MKNFATLILVSLVALLAGCIEEKGSADKVQNANQERMLQDSVASVGLPAIKNWREKRTFKMIYELRDQTDLRTYTYITALNTGQLVLLCNSMGYPINDATGYTNPDNHISSSQAGHLVMPQAEPNGLFTPDNSNSYWVICLDAEGQKASPVFIAGYPVVSTFPLK